MYIIIVMTIRLVMTVALRSEVPEGFSARYSMPVLGVRELNMATDLPNKFVLITGLGLDASASAAEKVAALNPLMVLNIGTAGSMNEQYQVGDFAVIESFLCRSHKPITSLIYGPFFLESFKRARLLSCSKALDKPHDIADLVDMEAFAQAKVFQRAGVPFSSLKYVSDKVGTLSRTEFKQQLPVFHKALLSVLDSFFRLEPPKVSVIIPSYNRASYLKRAIESVLKQELPAHELIVVDDGSTDETADLLSSYKGQITVIRHERNRGVSAARNSGLAVATGNWIGFLDSDDEWHTNKLLSQVRFLEKHPYYRWLQSLERWVRNGKELRPETVYQKPLGWAFKEGLERCVVSATSVLIHRSLFDRFGGFDTVLPACEDYDLWLRLLRYVPIALDETVNMTRYAGHDDQLSFAYPAMDRFRVYSLEKMLRNDYSPYYRRLVAKELARKQMILQTGAQKRKEKGQTWISDRLHAMT